MTTVLSSERGWLTEFIFDVVVYSKTMFVESLSIGQSVLFWGLKIIIKKYTELLFWGLKNIKDRRAER